MTKYHINFEGKIYPCKAKVHKCPYGEEFHSDNKIELYYKLMGEHGVDSSPSNMALNELKRTGRIKSLFSSSEAIANVPYPVDVIVATLKESLMDIEKPETKQEVKRWKDFEQKTIEDIRLALLNGEKKFPSFIPEKLVREGRSRFMRENGGKAFVERNMTEVNERRKNINKRLQDNKDLYPIYTKREESGLNYKNYESNYSWMVHDFEKFSHDLNTSKMITQPFFLGSTEKAKDTISKMDNYELLAAYDDYSLTEQEIEKNVKEANYFKFTPREDLSEDANKSLQTWYNRNREIYRNWRINTPKRTLMSIEMAKELDRRGIQRQDTNLENSLFSD